MNKTLGEALRRAWKLTDARGQEPVTIDADSAIREVSGKTKQAAAYGHTKQSAAARERLGPDFESLRPGYWVVYAGLFYTPEETQHT